MKGVVLAGGTGSRLYPLTKVTNKHLLPVGRYPMIFHPLMQMTRAGIECVVVVTSPEHMGDVVNLLGSGRMFGLDLTFRVQDEPGGIAQALSLCENFTADDPFLVILGDNILGEGIGRHVEAYRRQLDEQETGARILLKEVPDPERYGVPRIEGDHVVEIVEKPANPPSNYSVTGMYFYDPSVYGIIRGLTPSARGEYEISDVSNAYIKAGRLTYGILDGWWGDAGTLEGWYEANDLARNIVYDELANGDTNR
jgi:glucose-1-phosphate thymidylyltransferase